MSQAMKGSLLALGSVALAANAALAQQPAVEFPKDSKVSNVIEVKQMEPTNARIQSLKLPPGFRIAKFAEMYNPRMIAVADDGTVYVSQREPGTLVMLKDTNNDGRADIQKVITTRKFMHGIALRGTYLYFITIRELYRARRKADGTIGTPQLLIKDLPDAGQHPNRTIKFGPDGKLYISVGSTTNAAREPNQENATMLVADADGKNRKVFASGLRNTIGFGWHPVSGRLFGWDHGIDELGDNHQREEINEIRMGKRYGWPYIYENGKAISHPVPPPAYTFEDWRKMSTNPVLTHTAHSAGIQMTYYTGRQFPAQYRNDAFIVLRGSWNRNPPSGYQIARIRFDGAGRPVSVEPFVSGFLFQTPESPNGWGHFARLAGIAVARDGALLVSDDTNNIVYRISYGNQNAGRMMTTAMDARKITMQLPETANARNTIVVRSPNFAPNGLIANRHTAYDKNISPELRWSGVPRGAKSLVLMMEDPDSLNPKPFAHWIMANIPASSTRLRANLPVGDRIAGLPGAMQGATHTSKIGYFGPKPPADGKAHHYHFQ
ncbi:MAG TPA: YbhB/YbcL family Raf kinase inhibitor-like protein, partial [Abditibacteriaceae bacterium]|nr:YbhB/YbcL family Raf kinase inhibitor-like protein [Abditibacteriaceae bacterium]